MSIAERNPTMVAECGCPYDPKYDEGHIGWHLVANHPESPSSQMTPFGVIRQPTAAECMLVGRETSYSKPFRWHDYRQLGDYVIANDWHDLPLLAQLCEEMALGDDVHVIPGVGVYIEE